MLSETVNETTMGRPLSHQAREFSRRETHHSPCFSASDAFCLTVSPLYPETVRQAQIPVRRLVRQP